MTVRIFVATIYAVCALVGCGKTVSSRCFARNADKTAACISGCVHTGTSTMSDQWRVVEACDDTCSRLFCTKIEMKLNTGVWCKDASGDDIDLCASAGYRLPAEKVAR